MKRQLKQLVFLFVCIFFVSIVLNSDSVAQEAELTAEETSSVPISTETIPQPPPKLTENIATSWPTEAPSEVIPTQSPEITHSPESTEAPELTSTLAIEASPVIFPTSENINPLELYWQSDFESASFDSPMLMTNWMLASYHNGNGLTTNNPDNNINFTNFNRRNSQVNFRVYIPEGLLRVDLRYQDTATYTILLRSDNQLAFLRSGTVLQIVSFASTSDDWHQVQFSTIEQSVQVTIDTVEILSFQDPESLAAGGIQLKGSVTGTNGIWLDDLAIFVDSTEVIVPDVSVETPTAEASITNVPTLESGLGEDASLVEDSTNFTTMGIVFVVNTTSDSSDASLGDGICDTDLVTAGSQCSLRSAIQEANLAVGTDTIHFNIAGSGVWTITPTNPLPKITSPIILDGYSQTGAVPASQGQPATLLIELNGSNVGGMLQISSGESQIRGLVINRTKGAAISLETLGNNFIEGNYLGTDATGTIGLGNYYGLVINSPNNQIGGSEIAQRNLISSNNTGGIAISSSSYGNHILGNYVGTDATGTLSLGNRSYGGITLSGYQNTIGGPNAIDRNIISGNPVGIQIYSSAYDNQISGNYIGTDVTGQLDIGNTNHGIYIEGYRNVIGGTNTSEGNLIRFNAVGIQIVNQFSNWGRRNAVLSNRIYSNDGLELDLYNRSASTEFNDLLDSDTGANELQNYPFLASINQNAGNVIINGTLISSPNSPFRVEIFANSSCDSSGFGGGEVLIAVTSVSTNASGEGTFQLVSPLPTGTYFTATATDSNNNTSEFSNCFTLGSSFSTVVTNTNHGGNGSLYWAILASNSTLSIRETISFDIAGTGPFTIQALSPLPPLISPVIIDGYTQPGASIAHEDSPARLLIELDGTNVQTLLRIAGGNSIIRGLVINRSREDGLLLERNGGNTIIGNYIGTDASGMLDLGNGRNGINISYIASGQGNFIGGADLADRNLISGNNSDGLYVDSSNTSIYGNYFGTNVSGLLGIPNLGSDISIGSSNNFIGGMTAGQGNLIKFSSWGVSIRGGSGNAILGNVIASHSNLGINLNVGTIPDQNDYLDDDYGANGSQNYPVLSPFVQSEAGIYLPFYLNSKANAVYRLDFYANTACNGTGYGEAEQYLGSISVSTNANGYYLGSLEFPITTGFFLSATATDAAGSSSEFSRCVGLRSANSTTVINTADSGVGSLREAILNANRTVGVKETIDFFIPNMGVSRISPLSPLPSITDPVVIDGYTQPMTRIAYTNWPPVLLIEINGQFAGTGMFADGLHIVAGNSIVRGLVINQFSDDCIQLDQLDSNLITGNFIGTDTTGNLANGCAAGIYITNSTNNTIGGGNVESRNVISGNVEDGLIIQGASSRGNTVIGNYVGLGISGNQVANGEYGVWLFNAPVNLVTNNFISGNSSHGLYISGLSASNNRVTGNRIGTNLTGIVSLGNEVGVFIDSAPLNIIGGTAASDRNVISGNRSSGIAIVGSGADSNSIINNSIGIVGSYNGTDVGFGNHGNGIYLNSVLNTLIQGNYVGLSTYPGIYVSESHETRIIGNSVGYYRGASHYFSNFSDGIVIDSSHDNIIGGLTASEQNLISDNSGSGIYIWGLESYNNLVIGNRIGEAHYWLYEGNAYSGIVIDDAPNNIIGGTQPEAANIIIRNNYQGIWIGNAGATGNRVIGNIIGTNAPDSTWGAGNWQYGLVINGADGNQIGGSNPGEGNIIKYNNYGAIGLVNDADSNLIFGNLMDANGYGIYIYNQSDNNQIGGINSGQGNIIRNSVYNSAVIVRNNIREEINISNSILGNSIYGNSGMGIDLYPNGVTLNDGLDVDLGNNNLQNYPVILSSTTVGSELLLNASINSRPNTSFHLEFFANVTCDATGNGEGQSFIGALQISTDASGNAYFITAYPLVSGQSYITATATDDLGNTSEFSRCVGTTPPTVPVTTSPSLLAPAENTLSNNPQASFTWTSVAHATSYEVLIDNNSNFSSPEYNTTVSSLNHTLSSSLLDGIYYWRIRGKSDGGAGAWSVSRNFTIDTVAPPAPALSRPLNTTISTTARPSFAWLAASTANRYLLQVDNDSDFSSPNINTEVTTLSYTSTVSLPQGVYYWRVQARDAALNWGSFGEVRSFTVNIQSLPLNNAFNTDTTPAFQWYAWTGASRYQLQVSTVSDFSTLAFEYSTANASALTYSPTTPLPYGLYYWRLNVDAGSGFVTSPFYWTLTVSPAAPAAPVLVTPINNALWNSPELDLTWNASTSNLGQPYSYQLQVDNDATFVSPILDTSNNATSIHLSAMPDGKYYWRVRTVNYLGFAGVWSASLNFTIDTIAPAAPVLSRPLNAAITTTARPAFSWLAAATANRYRLQVDNDSDFSSPNINTEVTTLGYTSTLSLPQGVYYWRVQARDAALNWGSFGEVRSFTVNIQRLPLNNAFVTDTTPAFQWYAWTGASRYQLQVSTVSDFSTLAFEYSTANASALTYSPTTPLPYGLYYWRLNVDMGSGFVISPFSNIFTITPPAPTAPVLISPTSGAVTTDTTPTLVWNQSASTQGQPFSYQIQIDNNQNFSSPEQVLILTTTSFTTDVLPAGQYYWRVRTINYLGFAGTWSTVGSVRIVP